MSRFNQPANTPKTAPTSNIPTPSKPRPTTPSSQIHVTITHDQIADRARSLWQSKGSPDGQDDQIWLEAEAQLKRESQQV